MKVTLLEMIIILEITVLVLTKMIINNNKKHDKSVTVQFAKVGTMQSEFTLRTGKTALIRLPKFIPTN